MKEILLNFENELRNIDAPILKYFNDGLSKEKIMAVFAEMNLKPTKDIIELFEWKNGTVFEDIPSGKINFGMNGCFLALEELRHSYLFAMIDKLYPKAFFPILTSDDFLIDLDESSKDYKKIFIYCPSFCSIRVSVPSESPAMDSEALVYVFWRMFFTPFSHKPSPSESPTCLRETLRELK